MTASRVDRSVSASGRALGGVSRFALLVKTARNFSGCGELCFEMIADERSVAVFTALTQAGDLASLAMVDAPREEGHWMRRRMRCRFERLSNNRLEPTVRKSISMFEGGVVVGVGSNGTSAAAHPRR